MGKLLRFTVLTLKKNAIINSSKLQKSKVSKSQISAKISARIIL